MPYYISVFDVPPFCQTLSSRVFIIYLRSFVPFLVWFMKPCPLPNHVATKRFCLNHDCFRHNIVVVIILMMRTVTGRTQYLHLRCIGDSNRRRRYIGCDQRVRFGGCWGGFFLDGGIGCRRRRRHRGVGRGCFRRLNYNFFHGRTMRMGTGSFTGMRNG